MPLVKYVDRIEKIDQLIRLKSTGPPKEFAAKLLISERYLYELISEMKDFGAPINYCKEKKTYFYKRKVKFSFGFN